MRKCVDTQGVYLDPSTPRNVLQIGKWETKILQKPYFQELLSFFLLPRCFFSALLDACNWQPVVFLGQRFLDRLLFFLRGPSGTDSLSSRLLSSSFQSTSQSSSISVYLMFPTGLLCSGIITQSRCALHVNWEHS